MINLSSGLNDSALTLVTMAAQIDPEMGEEGCLDMVDRLLQIRDRLAREENLAFILASDNENKVLITVEMTVSQAFNALIGNLIYSLDKDVKRLSERQIKRLWDYAMLKIIKKFMDEDHEEAERITHQEEVFKQQGVNEYLASLKKQPDNSI